MQDGLDDIGDVALQGFVAHRERARKTHVMRGTADLDRGQDQHIGVHRLVEMLQKMPTDKRVGLQRQMRPVLLDGAKTQNQRNVPIQGADFRAAQFRPFHRRAAHISISTRKPATGRCACTVVRAGKGCCIVAA